MDKNLSSGFLLQQGQGLPISGTAFRYKIRPHGTGGNLVLFEAILQPGELIPPHTHTRKMVSRI